MSVDDLITRALADTPTASSAAATMIRFDGAMCVVRDHLGVEQTWRWAGTTVPAPGDPVQVVVQDGVHLVTGKATPTPTQGTVTAVSGTALQVAVAVGPTPITAAYTYASPAVGHIVALSYGYEGFIATGRSSYTPAPVEVDTDKGETETVGRQTFRASVAGRWWNGDWYSDRPEVGSTTQAGFHYGPSLGATLPDTAQITLARIYLPAVIERFAPPLVQALDSPPPASAGVGPQVQLAAQNGWIDLPTAVAEQLRTGNRGIRLSEMTGAMGTWTTWKSLSQDPMSGALDLAWKA